jgi:hypothetical protein
MSMVSGSQLFDSSTIFLVNDRELLKMNFCQISDMPRGCLDTGWWVAPVQEQQSQTQMKLHVRADQRTLAD